MGQWVNGSMGIYTYGKMGEWVNGWMGKIAASLTNWVIFPHLWVIFPQFVSFCFISGIPPLYPLYLPSSLHFALDSVGCKVYIMGYYKTLTWYILLTIWFDWWRMGLVRLWGGYLPLIYWFVLRFQVVWSSWWAWSQGYGPPVGPEGEKECFFV